jgi:hypothetical protein
MICVTLLDAPRVMLLWAVVAVHLQVLMALVVRRSHQAVMIFIAFCPKGNCSYQCSTSQKPKQAVSSQPAQILFWRVVFSVLYMHCKTLFQIVAFNSISALV